MNDEELKLCMRKKLERLNSFVIKPVEDCDKENNNVIVIPPMRIIQNKIHPEVKLLLYTVFLHQNLNVTKIYDISKLALSTGNKRKEEAVKEGLIQEFSTVIKKGRGSSARFLSITQKGYEFLGLTNKKKARGKAEHNFWIFIIREHFIKKDYKVYIEKYLASSNGFVDVLAEKGNEKIAVEVCIHKQNLNDIVQKLNKERLTRRILCFQTERQMEFQMKALLNNFSEGEIGRYEFKPLYEFY